MNNEQEVWKDTARFPGYQVSNYGNMRSFKTCNGKGATLKEPRPLKATRQKSGHLLQSMAVDGKKVYEYIHRLVAEAFLEKPVSDKKIIVRHIDDDPSNNHVSNLAYGTYKDNSQDRFRNFAKAEFGHKGNAYVGISHKDLAELKLVLEEVDSKRSKDTLKKLIDKVENWSAEAIK